MAPERLEPEAAIACYVDTSALIKRYIDEEGSEAFDEFCLRPVVDAVISPLGLAEFASALKRKRRGGELTARQLLVVRQRFVDDIAEGGWRVVEFQPVFFDAARSWIESNDAPLATLDALHLACALGHGTTDFATADRQLATAARKAKLRVHLF